MSAIEDEFEFQLGVAGLPEAVREYAFAPKRRYRADFAFPAHMLLVEIEGAIYTGGRHVRGAGYESDLEKYNLAQELGYIVLRFSPGMVRSGEALAMVERVLMARDDMEA